MAKKRTAKSPAAKKRPAVKRKAAKPKPRQINIHAIPKKVWQEMSGRQVKTINEQADRYDAPLRGAFLHLPSIVKWLHDFLAENKYRLKAATPVEDEDGTLMNGGTSPALEDLRRQKAALAKLDLEERRGELCSKDVIQSKMQHGSQLLRVFGEEVQKQSQDLFDSFEELMDEWGSWLDDSFGAASEETP